MNRSFWNQKPVRALAQTLARARRRALASSFYYPQVESCQIPHLSEYYSRFLGERTSGVFVDVGAHDGVFCSNTWGLAERNWRGILVEPDAALANACRLNHEGHPMVEVVEALVLDTENIERQLFAADFLSTASRDQFNEYVRLGWLDVSEVSITSVLAVTLDSLLRSSSISADLDVLSIDVEGLEAEVLGGFDLHYWCPKLIVVELIDCHPELQVSRWSHANLRDRISSAGYITVFADHINTIFVRRDVFLLANDGNGRNDS